MAIKEVCDDCEECDVEYTCKFCDGVFCSDCFKEHLQDQHFDDCIEDLSDYSKELIFKDKKKK